MTQAHSSRWTHTSGVLRLSKERWEEIVPDYKTYPNNNEIASMSSAMDTSETIRYTTRLYSFLCSLSFTACEGVVGIQICQIKFKFLLTFLTSNPFPSWLTLTRAIHTTTMSRTVWILTVTGGDITLCALPAVFTMTNTSAVLAVVRTQYRTDTWGRKGSTRNGDFFYSLGNFVKVRHNDSCMKIEYYFSKLLVQKYMAFIRTTYSHKCELHLCIYWFLH